MTADPTLLLAHRATDRKWSTVTGHCGGCGNADCHDGPCGGAYCPVCPVRIGQGVVPATHPVGEQ